MRGLCGDGKGTLCMKLEMCLEDREEEEEEKVLRRYFSTDR